MDSRVAPLVWSIRHWSKKRGINDAYSGKINSFGWTVMIVAFLQTLGILPCISKLDKEEQFKTSNTDSVGDLFLEFLKFVLAFDYKTKRISIRHGGVTDKEADKFTDDTVFCVERPRTPYQNVTRQVTYYSLKRIIFKQIRFAIDNLEAGALYPQLL
jgi:DNA polymerase sigma